MSKPDRSIDPRILSSAKKVFLTHGFQNASLKEICEAAGITTGALYKRYKGKEALFNAVVAETVAALDDFIEQRCKVEASSLSDDALVKAWDMDEENTLDYFRFFHEYRDGFILLLTCAEGTAHSNFQHDWVEKMTEKTYEYFLEAQKRGLTRTNTSIEEFHILLSAFWTTIYEPFIHDFTWEQIESHNKLICGLFNWRQVLGF
ncbi:TetR/AcrR family transcriptional regulator [Lacrimispora indolis]|uniref:TetR/AcrR family transcriptional regulator n=1 Tax=Lacrimispora indolis TaxID=69825 RepID=UPI000429F219|nr:MULTISPECIES: TetR/AcrR family transcriptional regulator [Lachnospiraceae]MBE7720381.1 TetR/AcrR family transcriptional regulator [Lacrimispora celerecrescens]